MTAAGVVARGVLEKRRAGVLAHVTSLPGARGAGTLGADACRFVDWLASCGVTVWQVLPLGPVLGADGSPYRTLSVHAGEPALIDAAMLRERGWLDAAAPQGALIDAAREGFEAHAGDAQRAARARFEASAGGWLDDYVLFRALKAANHESTWWDWPAPLRDREPRALSRARAAHAADIERLRFEQFCFAEQWAALKRYANERGVLLFGDMPIFVSEDSADVWAHRAYFEVDDAGHATHVAGVPPDAFSDTGQRWGNPLYRWDEMARDGYRWWVERMRTDLERFDLLRIDHFRGFESYWRVPAQAPTAETGEWCAGPGDALFEALHAALGPLALVAEDLGLITDEVHALRARTGLPGMKVLQFAFDSDADNPYLPHNHVPESVVYTGTHDNDTTRGWFESLDAERRAAVEAYLGASGRDMPWPLVRAALASVARLAVVPMQDLLALDSSHRMNRPGTATGNWRWRFAWRQVPGDLASRVHEMVGRYGRAAPSP